MIELPESHVLARQLSEVVKGRRVATAEAGHSPHRFAWYSGNPAEYRDRLAGKVVTGANVSSGHVRLTLDDLIMLISAPIRHHGAGEKRPKKHQLLLCRSPLMASTSGQTGSASGSPEKDRRRYEKAGRKGFRQSFRIVILPNIPGGMPNRAMDLTSSGKPTALADGVR